MNIETLENEWNRSWQGEPPIAEDLKARFNEFSLRIDSLPNGKRYPNNEAETAEIIGRYYAELNALRAGKDEPLLVIVTEWSSDDVAPTIDPKTFGITEQVDFWRTIDITEGEENREFKSYAHKFVTHVSNVEQLKSLLEMVSKDEIGDVIIGSEDLRWLFHPYDGGADMFVRSKAEKDRLSQKFADWISRG